MIDRDVTKVEKEIAHFSRTLWPQDSKKFVEVRCIRSRTDRKVYWISPRAVDQLATDLIRLNADGYNIYAGIHLRDYKTTKSRKSGDEESVSEMRCLVADWDGLTAPSTALAAVSRAVIANPTMIVRSGNGLHGYWMLEEPITDKELYRRYQRGLAVSVASDKSVCDPPRIMRMPGLPNMKDPENPRECRIVSVAEGAVYDLEDTGVTPLDPMPEPAAGWAERADGEKAELSDFSVYVLFVRQWTPRGERNSTGFKVACDFAASGYSEAETTGFMLGWAQRSGVELGELETIIGQAFKKPRVKYGDRDERVAEGMSHHPEITIERETGIREEYVPVDASDPDGPAKLVTVDAVVVNHMKAQKTSDARKKTPRVLLPISDIYRQVAEVTGGFPKLVKGLPFAIALPEHGMRDRVERMEDSGFRDHGEHRVERMSKPKYHLTEAAELLFMPKPDDFWSWLEDRAYVSYATGGMENLDGQSVTAPARTVAFKGMLLAARRAGQSYSSIEIVPHVPPRDDAYYAPCSLPPATGTALEELLAHLNPHTEIDRALLMAAIMTPMWGGPPGHRPAFIFTSPYGRGAGKSATAILLGKIYGGSIYFGEQELYEDIVKRLLGDDGIGRRVCLIDNVKNTLSNGGLESLITADEISGHRLYHGNFHRPNNLTWMMTANAPDLSRDLTERGIEIKIGQPTHGNDFAEWSQDFIARKRLQLIADIIDVLESPPVVPEADLPRDRWWTWTKAVLARVPGAAKLAGVQSVAEAISERRAAMDSDSDMAADIDRMLQRIVFAALGPMAAGHQFEEAEAGRGEVFFIGGDQLHDGARLDGIGISNGTKTGTVRFLGRFFDVPLLQARIRRGKLKGGRRGIFYVLPGSEVPGDARGFRDVSMAPLDADNWTKALPGDLDDEDGVPEDVDGIPT